MDRRRTILLIAGFGDNGSMYDKLLSTSLAARYRLLPLDLPGFGAPPRAGETTLAGLAEFVAKRAREEGAEIIVAHSVASIIAALAAALPQSPLGTILSLEGNLSPEDAYFSGTAADYDDPLAFRAAFLARLEGMSDDPVIPRYARAVAAADPTALWHLGCDARRFSAQKNPGEVLMAAGDVTYIYNPDNCPAPTLAWLDTHPMKRIRLDGASHWPSVDVPERLAAEIENVIG